MFVDLLLGMMSLLAFFPLITAYCACSYGRSFWLWFGLGCVLPFGSFLLLMLLLHRKELNPGEILLAEAKAILAAPRQSCPATS